MCGAEWRRLLLIKCVMNNDRLLSILNIDDPTLMERWPARPTDVYHGIAQMITASMLAYVLFGNSALNAWAPISKPNLIVIHFDGPRTSPNCFLLTTKTPQPQTHQPTSAATPTIVFFRWSRIIIPRSPLSAFAETGRVESSLPVLKQRSFTGRKPVISSALANTPCADLGVDGMLEKLNATLGTSYNLDVRRTLVRVLNARRKGHGSETGRLKDLLYVPLRAPPVAQMFFLELPDLCFNPGLTSFVLNQTCPQTLGRVLQSYITQNHDFGTAYAHLRPYWTDFATGSQGVDSLHSLDSRQLGFASRWIHNHEGNFVRSDTVPRRIWDLYANRVVPSWVTPHEPRAISHAWVDEKDRVGLMSPINGNRWPVPMPKDANLDLIRIEMLNLGVEYAWLDVLCLRQEGSHNNHQRKAEWRTDVPTIGNVYSGGVVCYFCGLGRPLVFEEGYFESDQCWFNRAWTLQEVPCNDTDGIATVVCGETGADTEEDINQKAIRSRVDEKLVSLRQLRNDIDSSLFAILSEMQKRVSVNSLDKIAGLTCLLNAHYWQPVYDLQCSTESAWQTLVSMMSVRHRTCLFFHYSEPGNGGSRWRPSWKQVMTQALPSCDTAAASLGVYYHRSVFGDDRYCGPRIMSGEVRGLAYQPHDENIRHGELVVKDSTGASHSIKVIADHQYPIPQCLYTLMGSRGDADSFMKYWVVGHRRMRGFEKLSVIHIADEDERRKLQELGVAKQGCKVSFRNVFESIEVTQKRCQIAGKFGDVNLIDRRRDSTIRVKV
ncbi:hypothetical protein F5146DRAFT_1006437 [Armillaria mellea]|nr:hypothetical protein F5146DRAFT_1006437 [Armillaria mellea]